MEIIAVMQHTVHVARAPEISSGCLYLFNSLCRILQTHYSLGWESQQLAPITVVPTKIAATQALWINIIVTDLRIQISLSFIIDMIQSSRGQFMSRPNLNAFCMCQRWELLLHRMFNTVCKKTHSSHRMSHRSLRDCKVLKQFPPVFKKFQNNCTYIFFWTEFYLVITLNDTTETVY